VQLVEADLETFAYSDNELGDEGSAVGIEEPVEGAAEAVVGEPSDFVLANAEDAGRKLSTVSWCR